MSKALSEEEKLAKAQAKADAAAKKAEEKAAAEAAGEDEEKSSKGVVVAYEGGLKRTYVGKDAKAEAAEFISKRPADRKLVK